MPKITVNELPLSGVPGVIQIATVSYKKESDPDTSFVVADNAVQVNPDGTLVTPLVIDNLDFSTTYTVRAVGNCGGATVDRPFTTPAITCPVIVDIIGSAA